MRLCKSCPVCGRRFHWCSFCVYDQDSHHLSEGYCSEGCLVKAGGKTLAELEAEDDAERERLLAASCADRQAERQAPEAGNATDGVAVRDTVSRVDNELGRG
jgi:hypothetical protein